MNEMSDPEDRFLFDAVKEFGVPEDSLPQNSPFILWENPKNHLNNTPELLFPFGDSVSNVIHEADHVTIPFHDTF